METKSVKSGVLPLRLENWVPTPLPIAYFGPHGQVIRLPFLDLEMKQDVMGVVVGGVCYRRVVYNEVHDVGFIGVRSMLGALRDEFYPQKSNLLGTFLSSDSVFARNFDIPTLDQLQRAYVRRDEFDATVQILNENGVAAEAWGDGCFICRNINDHERYDMVVDFGAGIVREYDPYDEAQKARPMVKVTERDPEYPVENGVFNWRCWEKEIASLYK